MHWFIERERERGRGRERWVVHWFIGAPPCYILRAPQPNRPVCWLETTTLVHVPTPQSRERESGIRTLRREVEGKGG